MVEYGSCLLSAINDAITLYTVVAMGPIPPAVENTKGEKDPCSISLTLSSYSLFLSSSCFLEACLVCYLKFNHVPKILPHVTAYESFAVTNQDKCQLLNKYFASVCTNDDFSKAVDMVSDTT